MPTAEELLEQSLELVEEPVPMLRISNDLRTIDIPEEVSIIGVENDDDVLRLHFEMPQHYGEFDLSEFLLRVNFINAQKEGDIYRVADATTRDGHIYFSWLVGRTATRYKGNTAFIICARKISADGFVEKEFNTTIASLKVLEGLETHEQVIQENPDIIELLLRRMSDLEASGVYYTPYVDDYGNLYWNPSAEGLPAVPVTNIKGSGVPAGGSAGQTLVKQSNEDGDAEWADMNLVNIAYTDAENEGIDEDGNILIVKADDSDKLGGLPPEYYIQPVNLLANSDFTNPVNPPSETSVDKWGIVMPGWFAYEYDASFRFDADGLTMFNITWITQRMMDYELAAGKWYTVAVYFADGTVDVGSGYLEQRHFEGTIVPFSSQSDSCRLRHISEWFDFDLIATNKAIRAVALYEGSYTADTLPPYVPKGYTAELTACQVVDHGAPVCSGQVVNNFTTTQEGFVADARTVKILNDGLGLRLKYARITYEAMSFAQGSQSVIPTTIPEGAPESGTVIAVILYAQYDNVFYQWNPQLLSGIRDVNTYSFAVNNLRGASFSTNVRGVVLYTD